MAFRYVAPAGTPIGLRDLKGWMMSIGSGDRVLQEFSGALRAAFGVRHCFFVSTGRAALTVILQALRQRSGEGRNEVVVPSYTCYSVPASVVRAGLKVRISDVDPRTLDYDYGKLDHLDTTNVLGIVSSNLYGIPNDLVRLSAYAEKRGISLIDDAAQCMGGMASGKYAGTYGTAGLFSLDKGKNITSIDGGIIVTSDDDLARRISSLLSPLAALTAADACVYLAKLAFYAFFLQPRLYWVPSGMPFLKLGTTIYDESYPIRAYSGLLGAMGLQLFSRIGEITAGRTQNAAILRAAVKDLASVRTPEYDARTSPVFLRFPLLIASRELRSRLVEALNRAGIGASTSYPRSIADIEELQGRIKPADNEAEGGRRVAEMIVTLPTHPYVTGKDLEMMISVMRDTCRQV